MRRLLYLLLLPVFAQAQIVPGVLVDGSYPEPAVPPGPWSNTPIGNGTCTSVSDSSGTLTVEAAGVDWDNACLVYQTVQADPARYGAQVYGRVVSISGTAASTAKAGPIVANNGTNTAAFCHVRWSSSQSKVTEAHATADGQANVGGIIGNATAIPVHLGVKFSDSNNACRYYEAIGVTPPANALTDFDGIPQPQTALTIDMSESFFTGFLIQSGHATNTATVTIDDYSVGNAGTLVDNSGSDLHYLSAFETGETQDKLINPDGWLRQTMDAANPGGTYSYSDQVLQSDAGVSPRAGQYMLRLEIRDADNPLANLFSPRSQYVLWKDLYAFPYSQTVTHHIQWSTYFPSAEFNPTFNLIFMEMGVNSAPGFANIMEYVPDPAGDWLKVGGWYWANGVKIQIPSEPDGFGFKNKIEVYKDEWVDYRIEVIFSNDANGSYKLYQRRPAQTLEWGLVVNYSGPIGYGPDGTLNLIINAYGGGLSKTNPDAGNDPIVVYFDEVRISDSTIGSAASVEVPN